MAFVLSGAALACDRGRSLKGGGDAIIAIVIVVIAMAIEEQGLQLRGVQRGLARETSKHNDESVP